MNFFNKDEYTWNEWYTDDRAVINQKLLNRFWPNHDIYWINNYESYINISSKLQDFKRNSEKKYIAIAQVEEDWFMYHNVEKIRQEIKNCPAWDKRSFLITNSYKDYKISERYIKTVYKPAIMDLHCYRPYDKNKIHKCFTMESIDYFTGFFYNNDKAGRSLVTQQLLLHPNKNCAIVTDAGIVIDNYGIETSYDSTAPDYPLVDIDYDLEWIEKSAVVISVETFNRYLQHPKVARFAPTFSEKTFKAMHMYRPCLVFAGYKSRDTLKKLGFDTWDWLIDWSFDDEPNNEKAFNMFLNEIKRLQKYTISELKHILLENRQKLIHNNEMLFQLLKDYDYNLKKW